MQDIFITFVGDDKGLAQSLSDDLEEFGMNVSRRMLRLGDSLSANVEDGFQEATFGVLVLSRALFSLPWPSQEISTVVSIVHNPSLVDRFLAVWHKIEPTELSGFSADLARLPSIPTEIGIDKVAQEIAGATRAAKAGSATTKQAPYSQMSMEQMAPLSSNGFLRTVTGNSKGGGRGAANSAFIHFLHRTAQISHTFSYYYLRGQITFEEAEKAGKQIEEALDRTVEVLNKMEKTSSTNSQNGSQS